MPAVAVPGHARRRAGLGHPARPCPSDRSAARHCVHAAGPGLSGSDQVNCNRVAGLSQLYFAGS